MARSKLKFAALHSLCKTGRTRAPKMPEVLVFTGARHNENLQTVVPALPRPLLYAHPANYSLHRLESSSDDFLYILDKSADREP